MYELIILAFCRYYSLGNYPQTFLQFFSLPGLYSSFMGKEDLCSASLWDERSIKPREQAYPETASPSSVFFLPQRALSLLPGPTLHHPPEGGPYHLVSAPDLRLAKGCWRWWTGHDCAGCVGAHGRTSERRGQSQPRGEGGHGHDHTPGLEAGTSWVNASKEKENFRFQFGF